MADILITYDLRAPDRDYGDLYEYLEGLGAKRALESVWFVKTSKKASAIRDELDGVVDRNDRVFVCEFMDWASRRLLNRAGNWLNGEDT